MASISECYDHLASGGRYGVADGFSPSERAVVYPADCLDLLKSLPEGSLQLIVTSPPYNIGKE
ncbi:MAG: hypothetical protein Q7T82_12815 [Armatimonadota bacterium]|nr:hypothetical protein [Armatimonadota bacterium]